MRLCGNKLVVALRVITWDLFSVYAVRSQWPISRITRYFRLRNGGPNIFPNLGDLDEETNLQKLLLQHAILLKELESLFAACDYDHKILS